MSSWLSTSGSWSGNVESTVVRLPAPTLTESNRIGVTPFTVSTRNPIQAMPLGSVACTLIFSFTSTRAEIVCDTTGGVTSFAADCTVTVTVLDIPRRPPASTANPVIVNVPPVASTVSVSV